MTTATPSKVAAVITADYISITLDGRYRSFHRQSEQGKKLIDEVKKVPQDLDAIRLLADIAAYVASKSFGRVILDDRDRLRLDGNIVDYIAASTFKRVMEEGYDVAPLVSFIENVAQNPDKSVAGDLYAFLEKGRLPITDDGCFHAFKRVRDDYYDHHSKSVLYALDSTVSMDRELCDPNRSQTCSRGLHACSFDYLSKFHGGNGRILIVKINPKDVTAIPVDYNQAKLRTCSLDVIGEIPEEDAQKHFTSAVDRRYPPQGTPAVDPEDATDATAAEGVTTTVSTTAPEAETVVTIDWTARGTDAGKKAGIDDAQNGYDYDPAFDMPDELAGGPDSARQVYSEAYIAAYSQGFNEAGGDDAATNDEDDETDTDDDIVDDTPELDDNGFPVSDEPLAMNIAAQWGAEDAQKLVDANKLTVDDEVFSIDEDDGDRCSDVCNSDLGCVTDVYDIAYANAFNAIWKPFLVETAKRFGDKDGREYAEGHTEFDADVTEGASHYTICEIDEDDEGKNLPLSAYNQAFVQAYSARFNEQNG